MNNVTCGEDERIDDLQRNGYRIIQKKKGFCFGMDAVLLSGFAQVKEGEAAVDLGTGTGIIPILLEARQRESILPVWRFRSRVPRWQGAVWCIIIWRMRLPSEREISKKPLPSLAGLLFQ